MLPTEKIVNEDPRVKSSIMFGRGKFQNGILVEPIEEESFDPYDVEKLDAFRNEIWSVILIFQPVVGVGLRCSSS